MIYLEENIRVCNRLLNRVMKNDYDYDFLFRIDPINYIDNRNKFLPRKFHSIEQVSIKFRNKSNKLQIDKTKEELIKTINQLLKLIEGRDYRKILLLKVIVIQ